MVVDDMPKYQKLFNLNKYRPKDDLIYMLVIFLLKYSKVNGKY